MSDDKKYSELDASGNLTGSETFSHLQVGKNVRSTLNKIKDWIAANLSFDSITLNTDPPVVTDAGTIIWNKNEYTIDVITGLGATIQVGQETLVLVYNNTGSITSNGKILHPIGAFESGAVGITYEFADASEWEKCQGTLVVATHDIPNNSFGLATRFGKVRGLDTSSFTGVQLYLTDDGSGDFTETRPVFPSYGISMGGSIKIDATDGEIFVSILGTESDTFNDGWDGAIRESFDFLVTSNGTVVTGSLSNSNDPTENLTLLLSSGFYTFDTTPAATIALTAGTDVSPQTNYIYIPKSTKVLTLSTSGFPTDEHCKVAQLEVQSAATVQSDGGAVRNQNINDHIKSDGDNGHILHIAERVRQLNAEHDTGTEATLTGTTTNGYIQVTGGKVWQMHKQTFPSFSMPTRDIIIINDFTTANRRTDNLNTITAYSDGSSWSNQWSNIVIWGTCNKTGEVSYVNCNLPSDGYTSEANAIEDRNNYTDYTIPTDYKGVGFLIARFTIKIQGGVITYNSSTGYQDLRGFIPNNIAGGGGGGGGVTTLLGLTDVTTASYIGLANYQLTVNSGETGTEFTEQELAGTGVTWGHIDDQSQTVYGKKIFNDNLGINTPLDPVSLFHLYKFQSNYEIFMQGSARNYRIRSQYPNDSGTLQFIEGDSLVVFEFKSGGKVHINQTPSTDSGSNDVLTYNSSTGAIEKTTRASLGSVTKSSNSITSAASITPIVGSTLNDYNVTALATNATINAPTGTATDGDELSVRFKSVTEAHSLTWNAIYRGIAESIPNNTSINEPSYAMFKYNSQDTKWDLITAIWNPA